MDGGTVEGVVVALEGDEEGAGLEEGGGVGGDAANRVLQPEPAQPPDRVRHLVRVHRVEVVHYNSLHAPPTTSTDGRSHTNLPHHCTWSRTRAGSASCPGKLNQGKRLEGKPSEANESQL